MNFGALSAWEDREPDGAPWARRILVEAAAEWWLEVS